MTTELEQYQIQLEQVELALAQAPGDPELEALKEDLLQVIELSKSLEEQEEEKKQEHAKKKVEEVKSERDKLIEKYGQPGQKVLAPWSKDGHYYRAVVEEVLPGSNSVAITFPEYGEKDLCKLEDILPDDLADAEESNKNKKDGGGGKLESHLKNTGRKDWLQADKEKRKFKKEKKAAKLQAAIEAGETSKKGWQSFQKSKKAKSGKVKKVGQDIDRSMFAAPENAMSSVFGSELVMTKAQKSAKYNARSLIPKQY